MWQGIAPSDRVVNSASVSFVGWAAQSLPFLNVGATNVFLSAWDARGYLELLQRERITHAFLVPTPWRMLLEEDVESYDISLLRKVGSAGEPLDESTLHAIRERVCAWIVNAYGSTESGTMAGTCLWGDEMNGELISCVGRPMMGADLRIVAVGGSPADEVPPGEVGEVLLTGPTLAREVYGDPERTAASFLFDGRRRWWRSKDLGRLDGCGRLFLEGRVDDMIISGGINVFPVLIENVLLSHERVRACAVVGAPDERWGQRICAFIVADGELDAEELRELVSSSELAGYQRPREYVFVEELPSTATNKLNRRLLREHAAAGDRA
jgi:acyl-coenzyme A synthetase/AMP-(fatty) acid ligase